MLQNQSSRQTTQIICLICFDPFSLMEFLDFLQFFTNSSGSMFLSGNYVFKLSTAAECFQPARVYLHSISISSTLMDADTESAPLADPGSCLLQTCGDGLSAAPADASEIQLDSNKLEPVEFDLHLRKSEEMAAGFKSWGDSQKSYLDSKPASRRADFIVFPITCLLLEVQLDI